MSLLFVFPGGTGQHLVRAGANLISIYKSKRI
jgi:hypothetical protein